MNASNLPPEGFQLDSEQLPEGFALDSVQDILADPNIFVLDDLSDLNVYVLDNDGEQEVYVLDEQESLVPVQQPLRSIIVQGPKGPRGEQGIPGLKGSTGELGEKGDSGKDAPPLEWEFCEVDHILDGGIRLRNPDGDWSKCKRIVGRDGKDGAATVSNAGVSGGGGGTTTTGATKLGELTDVIGTVTSSAADCDILKFNASSGLWENSPPGSAIGEANTASNIGPGDGWFAGKVGVELQFKTLVAGSGITALSTASTIVITASSSGHIIVDPAGSALPQRPRLQFVGVSPIEVLVSNIDSSTTQVVISASNISASVANLNHLVHQRNQLGHLLMMFDPTPRVSKYLLADPLVVVDRGGCIVNAKFAASCVPPFVLP